MDCFLFDDVFMILIQLIEINVCTAISRTPSPSNSESAPIIFFIIKLSYNASIHDMLFVLILKNAYHNRIGII
jgi:hypothetical protein